MAQVNDLLVLGKANFLNEITSSQLLRALGGIAVDSSTEESTSLPYFLGIKAFADGGNVVWSSPTNTANVIRLNASGTWPISISGLAAKATADANGNTITSTYAKVKAYNDMIHSSNEYTFASPAYSGAIWINYRTASGITDGNITTYNFGNGKGGTAGVTLVATTFNGNATTANYATSAGNADTLDNIDSTGFLRYYNSNTAISSTEVVNTPSYVHTVSTTGGGITTSVKPSGMDNAWGLIHLHTHTGNYATQLGFGGTTGNLYMRNAYNSATFGSWKTILDSGNWISIVDGRYLKLSGGTMTGLVSYKTTNYTSTPMAVYDDGTNYGHSLVIGAGGTTYIGAGEAASTLYSTKLKVASTEDLILGADGNIRFHTNADNATTTNGVTLNTSNYFYPQTNNTGSVGTSGNKWGSMYATTFYGALSGNATTASALTSITGSDSASSSAVQRRIWFSYSDNTTGRPAYDDRFTIQTSTGTLFAPIFSGNLSGNATTATSANALASTGYGNGNFTWYQTSGEFAGNSGWTSYLISNHGDGSSYYHQIIAIPFWGAPRYRRMEGSTNPESIKGWYEFITDENYTTKLDARYYTETEADSRFVNVTGDSMSGTLSWSGNISSLNFRTGHSDYDGVISYQTSGNEAMLFTTKNAVTSFMFVNGEDTITNMAADRWTKVTPGLQIKNNCVAIGGLISNGTNPSYKLWVNGTGNFSGHLYANNGLTWTNAYWIAPGNVTCTASSGGSEFSFDMGAGTQWHVWSTPSSTSMLSCFADNKYVQVHHHLQVGNYNNSSYALTADSFICNSWIRTTGDTGWYNESYGGGWYMIDSTYIRAYNGKMVYSSGRFLSDLTPSSWIDGQRYNNGAYNVNTYSNDGSYNPWMRATNNHANVAKWFSFGTLGKQFYWLGSATSRTSNGYDRSMTFNVESGLLYAPIVSGDRVYTGYDSGETGSVSCSNWFRSSGATGWYNATYGGGWYMADGTYLRSHSNKAVLINNTYYVGTTAGAGTGLGLYGTSAPNNYGIHMSLTSSYGKHGFVQGDWATYFCFDGATNRGWIFKQAGTNVASIGGTGGAKFDDTVFGYAYTRNNNKAAFMWDKPGSNYTGMGANGSSDTIQFRACDANGSWVDYRQHWNFYGDLYAYGARFANRGTSTSTSAYGDSALEIREYNFGGTQSDTWGVAPRLSFHWGGRVAAQIGLASNGNLYVNNNASASTTFLRIVGMTGYGTAAPSGAAPAGSVYFKYS